MKNKTIEEIEENFKFRLRLTRLREDLSQVEVAKKAKLKPAAISHFESGRRLPSFYNLYKLSKALNVSSDYLLGLS